jgi:hypothetical protein
MTGPRCGKVYDAATRARAQAAGARAFVGKHDAADALTPAIRFAAASNAA